MRAVNETQAQTVQVSRLSDDLAFLDIVTEWDTTSGYHQWKPAMVVPSTFMSRDTLHRVYAVANQKGGVGKTLTALELALAMVARGKRVRLIDADPQVASLSSWIPVFYPDDLPESERRSLTDVYFDRCTLGEATYPTAYKGLYLVPSFPDLATVEGDRPTGAETCLRYHLWDAGNDDFDVTIIDSGPSLGSLTVSALVAAQDVIIPVQAGSGLDIEGAAALYQTINTVQTRMNRDLRVAAIILTDFTRSKLARTIGAEMAKAFPETLIVPTRTCIEIGNAQLEKKALRLHTPDATTVLDYDRAAGVLLNGVAR